MARREWERGKGGMDKHPMESPPVWPCPDEDKHPNQIITAKITQEKGPNLLSASSGENPLDSVAHPPTQSHPPLPLLARVLPPSRLGTEARIANQRSWIHRRLDQPLHLLTRASSPELE
jgi:hypothetical protein